MSKAKMFTESIVDKKKKLDILYEPEFYDKEQADQIYEQLEREIEYYDADITSVMIRGKRIQIPRKQVAYGDEGTGYTFAGTHIPAKPWTPLLLEIKGDIEKLTGEKFSYLLINRYSSGSEHYIGYHHDDRREMLTDTVASLSFGAARDFLFKSDKTKEVIGYNLKHGDFIAFRGKTNKYWKHAVPKRMGVKEPRINLTFRLLKKTNS